MRSCVRANRLLTRKRYLAAGLALALFGLAQSAHAALQWNASQVYTKTVAYFAQRLPFQAYRGSWRYTFVGS